MAMPKKHLFLVVGTSGGHLFPAFALAEALNKTKNYKVSIIAPIELKGKDYFYEQDGVSFHFYPNKISFLKSRSFIAIRKIAHQKKPDLVIGFGGLFSLMTCLCLKVSGFDIALHEQNASFGRANKVLSLIASFVFVTYRETCLGPKYLEVGNPVREYIFEKAKEFRQKKEFNQIDPIHVLVLGGSQGALDLNKAFLKIFLEMNQKQQANFHIRMMCGSFQFDELSKLAGELSAKIELFSFDRNIAEHYQWADFLVARSGAGVVSECLLFAIPTLFIPYPYAGGHQKENVIKLEKDGLAYIIDHDEQLQAKLLAFFMELTENRDKISIIFNKLRQNAPVNAANHFVKQLDFILS